MVAIPRVTHYDHTMPSIHIRPNPLPAQLRLPDEKPWTPATFEAFCVLNPDVVCELDAEGNLVLMSPANADADNRNMSIILQLGQWLQTCGGYKLFGPSAGFTLPNNAVRSPDASLVALDDWNALTEDQRRSFAPVVPAFAVELRSSPTDPLQDARDKMAEYAACGCPLGWLVDPVTSELTVHRPGRDPEAHHRPAEAEVDPARFPGLRISFAEVWDKEGE